MEPNDKKKKSGESLILVCHWRVCTYLFLLAGLGGAGGGFFSFCVAHCLFLVGSGIG